MAQATSAQARNSGAQGRILDVLEVLAELGGPAPLADIAARVSLAKATTHRILQLLVDRGYALRSGEGSYGPGLAILSVAGRLQETLDLAEVARPAMMGLQAVIAETVHFALLDGTEAVYVEKLEGQRPFRMASRVGMRVPLHSTAIGKAILASLPEREWRERIPSPLDTLTAKTITDPERLAAELATVRSRGYAIDDEENEDQIRCVGAAVFDYRQVIGGISLSAAAFTLPLRQCHELAGAIMAAAAAVSTSLGARTEQVPLSEPSHAPLSKNRSRPASRSRAATTRTYRKESGRST